MSKLFVPTGHDIDILSFLEDQAAPVTIKAAIAGTSMSEKDARYSVTKLLNAGLVETTGRQHNMDENGNKLRGRPSRLIAITDNGRRTMAAWEVGAFTGRL